MLMCIFLYFLVNSMTDAQQTAISTPGWLKFYNYSVL